MSTQGFPSHGASPILAMERHYSADEIAVAWNVSAESVRRIFRDLPGVVKLERPRVRKGARPYVTLRIPESVLSRVHEDRARGFSFKVQGRGRGV